MKKSCECEKFSSLIYVRIITALAKVNGGVGTDIKICVELSMAMVWWIDQQWLF